MSIFSKIANVGKALVTGLVTGSPKKTISSIVSSSGGIQQAAADIITVGDLTKKVVIGAGAAALAPIAAGAIKPLLKSDVIKAAETSFTNLASKSPVPIAKNITDLVSKSVSGLSAQQTGNILQKAALAVTGNVKPITVATVASKALSPGLPTTVKENPVNANTVSGLAQQAVFGGTKSLTANGGDIQKKVNEILGKDQPKPWYYWLGIIGLPITLLTVLIVSLFKRK